MCRKAQKVKWWNKKSISYRSTRLEKLLCSKFSRFSISNWTKPVNIACLNELTVQKAIHRKAFQFLSIFQSFFLFPPHIWKHYSWYCLFPKKVGCFVRQVQHTSYFLSHLCHFSDISPSQGINPFACLLGIYYNTKMRKDGKRERASKVEESYRKMLKI